MTAPTTPTGTLTDAECQNPLADALGHDGMFGRYTCDVFRAGISYAAGHAHPHGQGEHKPSTGLTPTLGEALADAHEWIEGRLADQDFASGSLPVIMDAAQGQVSAIPREPTDDMLDAVATATRDWPLYANIWRVMFDATPPATPDKVSGEGREWDECSDGQPCLRHHLKPVPPQCIYRKGCHDPAKCSAEHRCTGLGDPQATFSSQPDAAPPASGIGAAVERMSGPEVEELLAGGVVAAPAPVPDLVRGPNTTKSSPPTASKQPAQSDGKTTGRLIIGSVIVDPETIATLETRLREVAAERKQAESRLALATKVIEAAIVLRSTHPLADYITRAAFDTALADFKADERSDGQGAKT